MSDAGTYTLVAENRNGKDKIDLDLIVLELMDIRLVICGLAVAVAMFALAWDYFYPFPASR